MNCINNKNGTCTKKKTACRGICAAYEEDE
jgi:hypothetical protein